MLIWLIRKVVMERMKKKTEELSTVGQDVEAKEAPSKRLIRT